MTRHFFGRALPAGAHGRRSIVVGGLIAGVLAITGGAAVAEPPADNVFHDRFVDSSSTVIPDFCGDLLVQEDVDFRVTLIANQRGTDQLWYFAEHVHGSIMWTNLANEKTFSIQIDAVTKDLTVTDNGDGTLTILVLATGSTLIRADGKLVLRDPGQIRFEILIDHGGTPTDPTDDVFLADLGLVKGSTGRNDTEGRDFCEDIHLFIG